MRKCFRKKGKKFSTVVMISRIERFYYPDKDKVLELLYFSDCDFPCINWLGDHFEAGDIVQLLPHKIG